MHKKAKDDKLEIDDSWEPIKDYFITLKQILSMSPPTWLVPDLIPLGGVGVLYGATNSYKSFFALHLASSCAIGMEAFSGKLCKEVPVFYIAAEAPNGFKLRVEAWIKHHGKRPENLVLRTVPVHIDQEAKLNTLIEEIKKLNFLGEHCLVVVDTLSANFTGNENSSDMAKFVQGCISISKEIDATVLIVHHTGKTENKGARGHNSLSANSDFFIRMEGGNLEATVIVEKLKDAPIGRPLKLRAIPIMLDPKAEISSSLVLEEDTGFEDEASHNVVLKCAIRIGKDKMSQKELRQALIEQNEWDDNKANRAIQATLPDNNIVEAGGFIIERVGSGKGQRHITVKNKTSQSDSEVISADVSDVEG